MIKPTVGRMVHYYPAGTDSMAVNGSDPLAAIIACVWTDTCVNLAIFDANGIPHQKTSVLLLQYDNPAPDGGYAEWMPYQKGQAAKTDELEARIDNIQTSSVLMPDIDNNGPMANVETNTDDGSDEVQPDTGGDAAA
jgi:hypothetical protein